ncbi:hypothetical protein M885DRAFT_562549 [Pelagophyceae sp. CCMP2097]|nr:hypothetical protein M885DRAFT_562549 [Pelagophyceae sp. CCMP2097]
MIGPGPGSGVELAQSWAAVMDYACGRGAEAPRARTPTRTARGGAARSPARGATPARRAADADPPSANDAAWAHFRSAADGSVDGGSASADRPRAPGGVRAPPAAAAEAAAPRTPLRPRAAAAADGAVFSRDVAAALRRRPAGRCEDTRTPTLKAPDARRWAPKRNRASDRPPFDCFATARHDLVLARQAALDQVPDADRHVLRHSKRLRLPDVADAADTS